MRIPLWKRCLSYLTEVHLESHSTEINPALHLVLVKGRLQLCTDKSIYSFEDQYDNFYQAFEKMQGHGWPYKSVLILGFGLGSIPKMLEHNFNLSLAYTAVEIDDVIIELVSDYVLPGLLSPVTLINADAFSFVMTDEATYDLICIDVFLDDVIPDQFKDTNFLEAVKARLAPHGCVLYNMLGDYEADQVKAKGFNRDVFSTVFPDAALLHTGTNFILVSDGQMISDSSDSES